MKKERKWTPSILRLLYKELVKRFGPHNTWGPRTPEGYTNFCNDFATIVTITSNIETQAGGVKSQISTAISTKVTVESSPSKYILNMAAALEAGFIDRNHMPDILRLEYKG